MVKVGSQGIILFVHFNTASSPVFSSYLQYNKCSHNIQNAFRVESCVSCSRECLGSPTTTSILFVVYDVTFKGV